LLIALLTGIFDAAVTPLVRTRGKTVILSFPAFFLAILRSFLLNFALKLAGWSPSSPDSLSLYLSPANSLFNVLAFGFGSGPASKSSSSLLPSYSLGAVVLTDLYASESLFLSKSLSAKSEANLSSPSNFSPSAAFFPFLAPEA
jgi:hypothetical protein